MEINKYLQSSPPPSKESLDKIAAVIEKNLAEIKVISAGLLNKVNHLGAERRDLLYLGSSLYDFYLLVEDCLLLVARTTDRWVPASLDWHHRPLTLMQTSIPDKRPPVLSALTVSMLSDYLVLYLNFHHQAASLTPERLMRLINNLGSLCKLLEADLSRITNIFKLR